MSVWRLVYDFRRPFWAAFGRVAFLEADSEQEAVERGTRLVAGLEPGADVTRLDVRPSSAGARAAHQAKVDAMDRWLANTTAGIPNKRGDL